MDPESGQLESSSAGTGQLKSPSAGMGFEAPGQKCLSNWKMKQTSTVDGCSLVGVSSNCLKTRSQPTKKTSSLIPVGNKGVTALKSGCNGIFFFRRMLGLGCPACFFCFCLSAYFVSVSFCFLLQEKPDDDNFSAS